MERRPSRPKSNNAAALRMKHNTTKNLDVYDVYKTASIVSKMRSRSKKRKKSPRIEKPESPPPPPPSPSPSPSPPPPTPSPSPPPPEPSPEPEEIVEPEEPVPDKLEEFLTCYVCKATFVDPKTLACLHSFCNSCLRPQDQENENENTTISCPLCSEKLEVSNIDELEATPFVQHMIKVKAIEDMAKTKETATENAESNENQAEIDNSGDKETTSISQASISSKDTDITLLAKCECNDDDDGSSCSKCSTTSTSDVQMSTTASEEIQIEERMPGTCTKHADGILDYFCSKCDCFICIECLITEHPHFQHGVSKVHDVAPRYKEVLGMLKTEAEYTTPELSRASEVYSEKASRTEGKFDQIKDKIRERKDDILAQVKELLDQQENQLLEQLQTVVATEKEDFLKQAANLQDDLNVLNGYCCLTENLIAHGNSFEVMETKTELIKRMHRICVKGKDPFNQPAAENEEEKTTIRYEVGNSPILNKDSALGYLCTPKAYGSTSTASGHGLVDVMCGHLGVFGISTKDRQGVELESGGAQIDLKIISSTMEKIDGYNIEDHEDGTYTVSYTTTILGPHIVSVTIDGIPIKASPFTVNAVISENYSLRDEPLMIKGGEDAGLSDPTGIATDASNQIYVVDRGNNRILVYSEKGETMLTINNSDNEENLFQSPLDIAITKSNKIIVSDSKNNQIQVFDKNGVFLHKFGKCGDGEGELKEPDGVSVDNKGNIVVADTMNHRVQIFREDGEFVSTFGRLGTKEGELRYPSGVAVDQKSGNILVCDCGLWEEDSKESNNRIQVFNVNGEYLQEFGSTGQENGQFKKPARITLDKKGRLLVSDMDNNRIQVFKANGTFLNTIVRRGKSDCFNGPCALAVMNDGRIVASERHQNQIQMF